MICLIRSNLIKTHLSFFHFVFGYFFHLIPLLIFLLYFFHYHLFPLYPLPAAIMTQLSMPMSPFCSVLPPPPQPPRAVSLLSVYECLFCLFILFIRSHIGVKSYCICVLTGLFHLARSILISRSIHAFTKVPIFLLFYSQVVFHGVNVP